MSRASAAFILILWSPALAGEVDDIASDLVARVQSKKEIVSLVAEQDMGTLWLVTDRLLVQGHRGIARAISQYALESRDPRYHAELRALGRYAIARGADWKALAHVRRTTVSGNPKTALKIASRLEKGAGGVFAVALLEAIARAREEATVDPPNDLSAPEAFVRAARSAFALGWASKCRELVGHVLPRYFCPEPDRYTLGVQKVRTLQTNLRAGEAILACSVIGREAVAVVVDPSGWSAIPLGPVDQIRKSLRSLADSGSDADGALRELRRILVEPLGLEAKSVFVVPQSPLAQVPWSTLIAAADVRCLPMRMIFDIRESAPPQEDGAIALRPGDVLGRSEARHRPERCETLNELVDAWTKKSRWRVIYVGCTYDPVRRRFDVAWAGQRWSLRREDLCHLPLRARVLVLAGKGAHLIDPASHMSGSVWTSDRTGANWCEGLRIKQHLKRTLDFAPVLIVGHLSHATVLPVWDVDGEAASAFLTEFHRRMFQPKARVLTALRAAKKAVAKIPKWRHPCYWAGWELWGKSPEQQ